MKNTYPRERYFVALIVLTTSCSHTIHCSHPPEIKYLKIPDFDTSTTTVLRVVRYNAGTGFSTPVDSSEKTLPNPFNVTVPADEAKDYEIVLLPQNRRHKLSNVHFGSEKRKGSPGLDSEQCTTSINFTFDGEKKTIDMAVDGIGDYTYLNL